MKYAISLLLAASVALTAAAGNYTVSSPDGRITVSVETGEALTYSVVCDGNVLLAPSEVSLVLSDDTLLGGRAVPRKVVRNTVDRTVAAPMYKRSHVRDHYNEMVLDFKNFDLIFRAYDEGVAYRFVPAVRGPFFVTTEQAEFTFPEDVEAFVPYVNQHTETLETQFFSSFENQYAHHAISAWNKDRLAFLPVLVETAGAKVLITESDLRNYPGMYLYNGNGGTTLEGVFAPVPKRIEQGGHNRLQGIVMEREAHIAEFSAAEPLPWRVLQIARKDGDLVSADLPWLLGKDPEGDFGWVKPGKLAWDWWNAWNLYGVDFRAGVNNDTYKYYIDFAAAKGIEYVILDEGWAVNLQADLFQVVLEIDLRELADYASKRGVGLILWAGYWAFSRDMEHVCRHYSEMGIKGFKVDFMDRDDQPMVDFYARAAAMAAKYHLVLDFHGAFKPAGLTRTFPNVLNFEGVYGLENMKWAGRDVDQVTYDVTIPFIRNAAGQMDYTQGAMRNAGKDNYFPVNSEPMSQGTRCRQLAEYTVFFAPLTMLCDSPSNYLQEPECTAFIAGVPTVWDETVVLQGAAGQYVAVARRSGDTWYVGAMTDWEARDLTLDLSFLGAGDYMMDVFEDGPNADRAARDYLRRSVPVPADRSMTIHMAPGGGWTAKIQ